MGEDLFPQYHVIRVFIRVSPDYNILGDRRDEIHIGLELHCRRAIYETGGSRCILLTFNTQLQQLHFMSDLDLVLVAGPPGPLQLA